ncbi:hypothetical protein M7I_6521 [Glarea lozoyensis 74030]|uniref:Uncharacterized protein n=1 Tax=Glarea lozoyensis (strain ATCC 74030 / MF5533) TaxID=1104152 RepID=H0EUT2_GLAL7|nr:hypothetical protein M7I_6521 [Glarea lozoyensis 74030]
MTKRDFRELGVNIGRDNVHHIVTRIPRAAHRVPYPDEVVEFVVIEDRNAFCLESLQLYSDGINVAYNKFVIVRVGVVHSCSDIEHLYLLGYQMVQLE